jgi:hypothetical protein
MKFNPNTGTTQSVANHFPDFPTPSLAFIFHPNLYYTIVYFVLLLQSVNVGLDLPIGYEIFWCMVHHHYLYNLFHSITKIFWMKVGRYL